MSTYSAFPVYPAIAGTMSNTLYTPNAAVGGTIRITLTGTTFGVRIQINNEQVSTGQPHLFLPSEAGWETKATVVQAGTPTDIFAPARWVRLIVDSGSVAGGTVEEMDIRASTTVDLTARAGVTSTQSAIGNTALVTLRLRYQADGYQFVDGSRFRPQANGTAVVDGGRIIQGVDGIFVREYTGHVSAVWYNVKPGNTAAANGANLAALMASLTGVGGRTYVELEAGLYLFDRTITVPPGVTLAGQGQGATIIQADHDLGIMTDAIYGPVSRPVPLVTLSGGSVNTSARLLRVTVYGPAVTRTLGQIPCAGGGVLMFAQTIVSDVSSQFFASGLMLDGDHQQIQSGCIITNNGYNVDFVDNPYNTTGAPNNNYSAGDQSFIYADMTGATISSIRVGLKNQMLSVLFVGGHTGFGPFSIYRPAGNALSPMMYGCTFLGVSFEGVGNGAIRDDSTTGANSMIGCKFVNRVGSGWYPNYNTNTFSKDYCVDVRGIQNCVFEMGDDPFTADPSGSSIGAIRDRSGATFAGSVYLKYNNPAAVNGNSFVGLNRARIEINGATGFISTAGDSDLLAGECVEAQNFVNVRRWGTYGAANANPFVGIAAYACAQGGSVAVMNKGSILARMQTGTNPAVSLVPVIPTDVARAALGAAATVTAAGVVGYALDNNGSGGTALRYVTLS